MISSDLPFQKNTLAARWRLDLSGGKTGRKKSNLAKGDASGPELGVAAGMGRSWTDAPW